MSMSGSGFQKGNWNQIPSNCSRNYTLTFSRCAQWGTVAITQCASWAVNAFLTCAQWAAQALLTCVQWASTTQQKCASWSEQQSQQCCTWWPCDWACDALYTVISWVCAVFTIIVEVFCVIFAIIVIVFCAIFMLVVIIFCAIWAVLVYVFCLFWSIISIIFCISKADGGTAFLLTDGTVIIQESDTVYGINAPTTRWWRLSPDNTGTYTSGSWSRIADANVARRYFTSGVLADGRVVVCGGEYTVSNGALVNTDSNACEIYDPVANTWTVFTGPSAGSPPAVWANIGDAPCAVLPQGAFLMGSINNANIAKLDPATLTWTAMNQRPSANSSEESWVLMPDNTISAPSNINPGTTWVYSIASDTWTQGNNLPNNIIEPVPGDVGEIGPGLLRYDGTAFFIGGNQNTAIYSASASPQWTNGPTIPQVSGTNQGVMDGPGAILVNGNILVGVGPLDAKGDYLPPTNFFEYDGTNFNLTNNPPNNNCPTYKTRLLLLPNGDVFFCREDDDGFYAYRPANAQPQASWKPVIQNAPASVVAGAVVQVSGTQFNGLSQAVAYGDDVAMATNYPLVRLINSANGQVTYATTSNHTTVDSSGNTVPSMGVATGSAVITTTVNIPSNLATGNYSLVVVANGIASDPVSITVTPHSPTFG
jgi:hypothetical protein